MSAARLLHINEDGQPIFQETLPENPPPWELLENGRYMPRRIRGSFPGRELG